MNHFGEQVKDEPGKRGRNDSETQKQTSEDPKIELFVKASDDADSVGCCPFGQRLFMILWLKGTSFTLTTVDTKRTAGVSVAPGVSPPFIVYNDTEVISDVNKIEEFLEKTLAPPRYPKLRCRNIESRSIGQDIFQRFSAYIKNSNIALNGPLEKKFLSSLVKLNMYLEMRLPDEPDQGPDGTSSRLYLDGDSLTLEDCNLLPKLNIVNVVCRQYRNFTITLELKGLTRYLENAYKREEFRCTCPNDVEILMTYSTLAKYLDNKQEQRRIK